MFVDPERRPARSSAEFEWLQYAGEYKQARGAPHWAERNDFVLSCLHQLDTLGGLTEKQWSQVVQDYRLPDWRRYHTTMEAEAEKAARAAAARVQQAWKERLARRFRPSRNQGEGTSRPHFAGCDHMSGPCSCFNDGDGDDDYGFLGWGADGPN